MGQVIGILAELLQIIFDNIFHLAKEFLPIVFDYIIKFVVALVLTIGKIIGIIFKGLIRLLHWIFEGF